MSSISSYLAEAVLSSSCPDQIVYHMRNVLVKIGLERLDQPLSGCLDQVLCLDSQVFVLNEPLLHLFLGVHV